MPSVLISASSMIKGQDLFSARRYPDDVRSRAIAAVDDRRLRDPFDRTIFREIADEFGIGEQSLRLWVKKHDADGRKPPPAGLEIPQTPNKHADIPMTSAQLEAEVRTLRKKVEKLQAENDVLKRAFVVFSSEWEK